MTRNYEALVNLRIVAAQPFWALAQAAIIILLARQGEYTLVALVVLGFAINAPLSLLFGLNLRNRVAIDVDRVFEKSEVVLFRIATSIAALSVTSVVVTLKSSSTADVLVAMTILATRLADQVADTAIGFYQRDGQQEKIARSLMWRGAAVLVPFSVCYITGASIALAAALALLFSLIVCALIDVGSSLTKLGNVVDRPHWRAFLKKILSGAITSPYPFGDTLHFNSLRYTAAIFFSVEELARIGIAQTLYAPIAMVITAIGYSHLSISSSSAAKGDWGHFMANLHRAIFLGAIMSLLLAAAAWISPAYLFQLVGLVPIDSARPLAVLLFLSLVPQAATGFVCQSLLAVGRRWHYVLNPFLGFSIFALLVFLLEVAGHLTIETMLGAFFIASFLRCSSAYAVVIRQHLVGR